MKEQSVLNGAPCATLETCSGYPPPRRNPITEVLVRRTLCSARRDAVTSPDSPFRWAPRITANVEEHSVALLEEVMDGSAGSPALQQSGGCALSMEPVSMSQMVHWCSSQCL